MKYIIFFFFLLISSTIFGQNNTFIKPQFLRVYNLEGKKINKGYIISINDSALVLNKNYKTQVIPFTEIGSIKTKRSYGNNVAISIPTSAALAAFVTYSTVEDDPFLGRAFVTSMSGVLGALGGFLIGTIIQSTKNIDKYPIHANKEQWDAFKIQYNLFYNLEYPPNKIIPS
mgnify:CR=1 FL=1